MARSTFDDPEYGMKPGFPRYQKPHFRHYQPRFHTILTLIYFQYPYQPEYLFIVPPLPGIFIAPPLPGIYIALLLPGI